MKSFSPKHMPIFVMLLCKAVISAMTAGCFLYLVLNYYPETDFHFKGFIIFIFLYAVVFFAFASTYRCFRFGTLRYKEIVFAYILTTFMTNFVMYFVLSLTAKMMLSIYPLFYMMLVQWVLSFFLLYGADRMYFMVHPARNCIVICSAQKRELVTLDKFENVRERYRIREICDETEGLDGIKARIEGYSTVILGEVDNDLRLDLTEHCFEKSKRLFFIPTVQDIIMNNAHETFVGDSLLYLCKNRTFTIEQLIAKRLMDVAVSVIGVALTSPLMLAAALAIKTYDGGPVFFRQVRYTRNLNQFTLIKFRSMVVDAEKDGAKFTVSHDARITPVGRFIRRYRIDELPQFFNVLRGEMSLVGPRAERIENVDYYCELMPEFRYRMKVKAGITGYAQIYGKYNTSYEDKLKMDLLYIENCSLVRDLQLLFSTIKALFSPESTEGFETQDLFDLQQQIKQNKEQVEETEQ